MVTHPLDQFSAQLISIIWSVLLDIFREESIKWEQLERIMS